MEEINLLQNRIKDTTFEWERQSRIVIGILSFIFIVILIATATVFVMNSSTQKELETASSTLDGLKTKLNQKQNSVTDAKTFQAQLMNLKSLINSRTYLSPVMDELSKLTYTKSRFVSLDVAQSTGKIHLEGRTDTYEDLGKLLLGLSTSTKFKSVKLLSVIPSTGLENEYHFSIDIMVEPELFTVK